MSVLKNAKTANQAPKNLINHNAVPPKRECFTILFFIGRKIGLDVALLCNMSHNGHIGLLNFVF